MHKTTKTPLTGFVTLTPEQVTALLEGNVNNRHVRTSFVEFLAAELLADRWLLTTDSIGVAKTGRLLNGQHRLLAIVKANKPAKVLLTTGMDEESFLVLDTGNKRSTADNTGLPPSLVSDATMMLYFQTGGLVGKRLSPQVIRDATDWYSPTFTTVMVATNKLRRAGLDGAPVRVGVGLRWAIETDPKQRAYALDQYRLMLEGNVPALSRGAATLWARLQRDPVGSKATDRMKTAAMVFYMMDWRKRDTTPIVRNMEELLSEVRQWARAMPDAFLHGPMRSGHPYAWQERPSVERKVYGAAARRVAAAAAREKITPSQQELLR